MATRPLAYRSRGQRAPKLLLMASWWGSSSQSWQDEEWKGDQWWPDWKEQGGSSNKKDKEKDRFKNVTSLGAASKHPLPLEDRKSLLVAVVSLLSPDKILLSKIAVSTFSPTTTHALLYWLCRATPRMSIRLLRDEDGMFTIPYAAQQLAETAESLHQSKAFVDPWLVGPSGSRVQIR